MAYPLNEQDYEDYGVKIKDVNKINAVIHIFCFVVSVMFVCIFNYVNQQ